MPANRVQMAVSIFIFLNISVFCCISVGGLLKRWEFVGESGFHS